MKRIVWKFLCFADSISSLVSNISLINLVDVLTLMCLWVFRKLVLINSCKHIDHSVNRGTSAAITIHFTDYWADHSLSFSFLCFSKTMKWFRFKPVESRNGKNFHCKAGPNSSLSIDSISVKELHHRTFKAGKCDWRLTRLSKRDWSLGHRNDSNNWML